MQFKVDSHFFYYFSRYFLNLVTYTMINFVYNFTLLNLLRAENFYFIFKPNLCLTNASLDFLHLRSKTLPCNELKENLYLNRKKNKSQSQFVYRNLRTRV